MKVIPLVKYDIATSLNKKEIKNAMAKNTAPNKISLEWPDKAFQGKVLDDSFKVIPVQKNIYNSFAPLVEGKTENGDGGSVVHIKMRMTRPVELLSYVFLAGIIFMWICLLSDFDILFLFFAILFTVVFFAMTLGGFNSGANRAKAALNTILKNKNN